MPKPTNQPKASTRQKRARGRNALLRYELGVGDTCDGVLGLRAVVFARNKRGVRKQLRSLMPRTGAPLALIAHGPDGRPVKSVIVYVNLNNVDVVAAADEVTLASESEIALHEPFLRD